ncbi:hypothetical protein NLX86_06595 [Streptomyces sp. A3M-1-3]|uniref:hypothetical protein n=1 Tax=Streptomyces sp. A3M-1-3 TaxID=2962044 RepID=UPI0020B6C46D|nr:hypothetical protein [Streptomyces sp. A3M-1-3]MCP3817815.1 hypothetical protein [Streptomyces sp. A3M-1-3]
MTATQHKGHSVIHDDPVTGIRQEIRKLLLDNGSEVYGCQQCAFTSETAGPVQHHLKTCGKPTNKPAAKTAPNLANSAMAELTLGKIMTAAANYDDVVEERDYWKSRARTAETKLDALNKAVKDALS